MPHPGSPRVVIACEHASARFGGEAALPLHYFRVLRERGFEVRLITHERTRAELDALFPGEAMILYVRDTWLHKACWRIGSKLPARIAYFTFGLVSRLAVQYQHRLLIRRLVAEGHADIVHQPMPVSPKEPSLLYDLGVPVVIGPLNGGMSYPPGLVSKPRALEGTLQRLETWISIVLNRVFPGKRRASILAVANERTRRALPPGAGRNVIQLVENGVDTQLWAVPDSTGGEAGPAAVPVFIFMGRLVDWKAVDILLRAFHKAAARQPMSLLIVGDGPERSKLQQLARELGILAPGPGMTGHAHFAGWLSQTECASKLRQAQCLVLPSLYECGGAVVLEAMCAGKPVIATNWGGPADYLDANCGILVAPTDPAAFAQGLEEAMVQLAGTPARRIALGTAGRQKAMTLYDWNHKVDRMIDCYQQAIASQAAGPEA